MEVSSSTLFLPGLQKSVVFFKKKSLTRWLLLGFGLFGLNLGFVEGPNLVLSGISVGFQLFV